MSKICVGWLVNSRAPDRAFALPDRCAAQRCEHFVIGVLGGTQMEFFGLLVVFVDRPAVETGDLHRPRNDRFETVSMSSVELMACPTSPSAVS